MLFYWYNRDMFSLIGRTKSLATTLATIARLVHSREFAHIISLNTENFVIQIEHKEFHSAFVRAEVVIADGVGIRFAAKVLGIPMGDRITGVDLMRELVMHYKDKKILFLGGAFGSAERTMNHFKKIFRLSNPEWMALSQVDKNDQELIHEVLKFAPHICFVAFGSPAQELWIEKYRRRLSGVLCMGVGQGMDVYGGVVKRAPLFMRRYGLEWLYRLIRQPWRLKRQMRLIKFLYYVLRARLFGAHSLHHQSAI